MKITPITLISPRPLGEALLAHAAAKGIHVREVDLLSFHYPPIPGLEALLEQTDAPLVFTSRHAVRALKEAGKDLAGRSCYAISGATAEALRNLGVSLAATGDNARQLVQKIAEDAPAGVLFFSGNIRRTELLDILDRHRIAVTEQVVYEKTLQPVRIEEPYDGILFFSGSQVDAFLQANRLPPEIPAFCIGDTTAAHLSAMGHPLVFAAPEPLPTSVLEIVCHYFEK